MMPSVPQGVPKFEKSPAPQARQQLFCFASKNMENIRRGFAARKWAVATTSSSNMKSRITKARRYFSIGSKGLLYCNPTHSFTVPFIVESAADPTEVVKDIWPEPWVLPFAIRPLGCPERQLSAERAIIRWEFLQNRISLKGGGVPGAMNLTGTTVFVPVEITESDWRLILRDLADDL